MITTREVREKYLAFFQERGHKIISPSPLVLESDPTTLFTSSGMQPLVPYLMGQKHQQGTRLVDSQPSIRLQDIEEVGDNRHTTYFEMLGNWSLGDYFKKEQLPWIWEFLTNDLGIPKEKLYVSVFEGTSNVPRDIESFEIWKDLGLSEDHIFEYGVKKNWWSRSGTPDQMPEGEIGGPDSEIFYEFDSVKHRVEFGPTCHPNCDCGRFIEIGNSVFIQYIKKEDGNLEELPQKNVDFGGGLERIMAALNNDPDVFKTDAYWKTIKKLEEITGKKYEDEQSNFRIVADHLRASQALIDNGVIPSNKMHGYVLRRLLRRVISKLEKFELVAGDPVMLDEYHKFKEALKKGKKELEKIDKITGKIAFDLYQSYGFPLELTVELFKDKGQEVNLEEFTKEFEKHKDASRSTSKGMFKGGLGDKSDKNIVKLHTATHLLHASLRKVLGNHVSQKGSHITAERLRFDFSHPQKLSETELETVEALINEQIKKKLLVTSNEMNLDKAIKSGALHFFGEKYGDVVKVYSVGDFSKEVCGGPHVGNTSEVGRVKIIKQEKIGAGIVRIYASLQ